MANDSRDCGRRPRGDKEILFGLVSNVSNLDVFRSTRDEPIVHRVTNPKHWWMDKVGK